ncbi:MAG: hypothetical protein ACM3JK_06920 [Betaproteobacteria bacterium]
MKRTGLTVLLLAATLLAACEQKPYQPPVPHTEPQREAQDKPKTMEKAAEPSGPHNSR